MPDHIYLLIDSRYWLLSKFTASWSIRHSMSIEPITSQIWSLTAETDMSLWSRSSYGCLHPSWRYLFSHSPWPVACGLCLRSFIRGLTAPFRQSPPRNYLTKPLEWCTSSPVARLMKYFRWFWQQSSMWIWSQTNCHVTYHICSLGNCVGINYICMSRHIEFKHTNM